MNAQIQSLFTGIHERLLRDGLAFVMMNLFERSHTHVGYGVHTPLPDIILYSSWLYFIFTLIDILAISRHV